MYYESLNFASGLAYALPFYLVLVMRACGLLDQLLRRSRAETLNKF